MGRRRTLTQRLGAWGWVAALVMVLVWSVGCGDDAGDASSDNAAVNNTTRVELPASFVVEVLMPVGENDPLAELEAARWAVDVVNASGGIAGEVPLELRFTDTQDQDITTLAEAAAADPDVVAVLGPAKSDEAMAIIPILTEAQKPLVAFSASSGEVLRAFSGSPYIWRTKLTDLAMIEWLVREARRFDAGSLGLLVDVEHEGGTFFNWFGFMATEEGYAASDLHIEVFGDSRACDEAAQAILDAGVERVIVVPPSEEDLTCIADAFHAARDDQGRLPLQVIIADTGLDLNLILRALDDRARGWQGWTADADPNAGFTDGWIARFGHDKIPTNSASAYDAVLLIAYGLEAAGGATGEALAEGMRAAVDGRGDLFGPDAAGVQGALEALRRGESPNINGMTGPLEFDDEAYVDLIQGTFAHWIIPNGGPWRREFDVSVRLGEGTEGPAGRRRPPREDLLQTFEDGADTFVPATETHERLQALIVSVSSGWENYRHQADALALYRTLRGAGVSDDDIVMIGADDLAQAQENTLQGIVRNLPLGDDVYASVVYDYDLTVTPEQIGQIMRGEESVDVPHVLSLDEGTNLLVFMVGHGGTTGLLLDGQTIEDGIVSDSLSLFRPTHLREALCDLRAESKVRRVFVAIEACYGGVFGDASYGGIEAGCDGGETPLEGVVMMTAANTLENSLGTGYDPELSAWVGDEFAVALNAKLTSDTPTPWTDVYSDLYLSVSGSHVSVYNATYFGKLGVLSPIEFVTPGR